MCLGMSPDIASVPICLEYRPVRSPVRAGVQMGLMLEAFTKAQPSARRSRLGRDMRERGDQPT